MKRWTRAPGSKARTAAKSQGEEEGMLSISASPGTLPVPVSGRRHRYTSLRVWLATDCSSVQIGVNKAADAAELRDSVGGGTNTSRAGPALSPGLVWGKATPSEVEQ